MGASVRNIKTDVRQLEGVDGRASADTIRLWESYREQAYLWRALSLLQMPATALSIAMALVMYFFADTIIEVPEKPQPGYYSVKQLPDAKFVSVAIEMVNLSGSYQPSVAKDQFVTARKYLWEPALSEFETQMMKTELKTIEDTSRSQLVIINKPMIVVERFPEDDYVAVRVPGIRYKMIGPRRLQPDEIVYYIRMTTIPRNVHNEYGIVVVDLRQESRPLGNGQQ